MEINKRIQIKYLKRFLTILPKDLGTYDTIR